MRSIINPRDFVVHPVPVSGPQDRMDRLASITAEQMAFALSFLAGFAPETFDAILDAAKPCSGDLLGPDEAEPRCAECDAPIGIFLKHGLTWQHSKAIAPRPANRRSSPPAMSLCSLGASSKTA